MPLCDIDATPFQLLLGPASDALRCPDRTTWNGTFSACGHALFYHGSPGTSRAAFCVCVLTFLRTLLFFLFLWYFILSSNFHHEFVLAAIKKDPENEVWFRLSRRLLGGFERGLLCCLRQPPAQGKAPTVPVAMGSSSSPESKRRTQLKMCVFPAHFRQF